MAETAEKLMSVDEFLLWGEGLEGKWELHDGVSMSPERALRVRVKFDVTLALKNALAKSKSICDFSIDGLQVRISERKSYQPDALVYCDEDLSNDAMEVENPLIVVEVLSPSTESYDLRDKLQGYFSLPPIEHYLIVDADKQLVIHHRRGQGGEIITRLVTNGVTSLKLPGIELAVQDVFAP